MKESKSRSAVSDGDKAQPPRRGAHQASWETRERPTLRWVLKTVTVCEGVSEMKGGTGKTQGPWRERLAWQVPGMGDMLIQRGERWGAQFMLNSVEGWRGGGVEEGWTGGGVEGWRGGCEEGWRGGGVEGWRRAEPAGLSLGSLVHASPACRLSRVLSISASTATATQEAPQAHLKFTSKVAKPCSWAFGECVVSEEGLPWRQEWRVLASWKRNQLKVPESWN